MKLLIITVLALLRSSALISQDITIYHGSAGQSAIFLDKKDPNISSWKDSAVFIRTKNDKIEVVILNPNPLFYTYEIKLEEFEIKEQQPDIGALLDLLNALPALAPSPPKQGFLGAPAVGATGGYVDYFNFMEQLERDIAVAQTAITTSDAPETKLEAFSFSSSAGYRLAQATIKGLSATAARFNSAKLLEELDALAKAAVEDPVLISGVDATNAPRVKQFNLKAFLLLNRQLSDAISKIKKAMSADPVQRLIIPVTEKNQRVRLIVKKKDASGTRMEFDKLLCVLIPEFDRPLLELVPVVNLTYASSVPEYSLKNGIIAEQQGQSWKFRIGAMLLYNVLHFGKYKEGALGIGLGYNIPKKNVLESFYLASLVSYKNAFRIGFGGGFSSYPSSLKNGVLPGSPLPADVKNIEDIVDYKNTLSFFISFSIAGITILKK